jgi:pyruvate kinase
MAPKVPVSQFKRTKIISTIGPATEDYETILELISSGVNGLRLNFSHGTHEWHAETIKRIRRASRELDKPVAIIQDLHGPKMQLGDFEGIINVRAGQSLAFKYKADYEATGMIPVQFDFSGKVKRGERLSLFDGHIRTVITSVKDGVIHVRADSGGMLIKGKGVNLPDTNFEGDLITAKDRKDLAFGSTQDFDYVAVSFIQTANDIRSFKRILRNLGSDAKVIAKIETVAAVENIEEIIEEADVIMIARGDLAIETQPESVPIVQRRIIGLGMRYAKPTIVATQMLASMTERSEPTRAEVSDVASAVIVGADCVMLSEETAVGKHPIEAVKTMKRIVMYTQENMPLKVAWPGSDTSPSRQSAVCKAIINLAEDVDATAIVTETKSGATAFQVAARRPERPVIAVTSDERVAHQLVLGYGIKSFLRPDDKYAGPRLTEWLQKHRVLEKGDMVVSASGRYPGVVGTTDTIKVRVLE